MKDPYFKYLAVTIVAGVIIAFVRPAHAAENKPRPKPIAIGLALQN